jgi:hypothetical protein
VVACDNVELFIIGADGERWHSERMAMDGIVLDRATEQRVEGKVWQYTGPVGWYGFTFDVAERRVDQGAWITDDFKRFVPVAA